jgi:hypothetical protein
VGNRRVFPVSRRAPTARPAPPYRRNPGVGPPTGCARESAGSHSASACDLCASPTRKPEHHRYGLLHVSPRGGTTRAPHRVSHGRHESGPQRDCIILLFGASRHMSIGVRVPRVARRRPDTLVRISSGVIGPFTSLLPDMKHAQDPPSEGRVTHLIPETSPIVVERRVELPDPSECPAHRAVPARKLFVERVARFRVGVRRPLFFERGSGWGAVPTVRDTSAATAMHRVWSIDDADPVAATPVISAFTRESSVDSELSGLAEREHRGLHQHGGQSLDRATLGASAWNHI